MIQNDQNEISIRQEMQLNIQGHNNVMTPEVTKNYKFLHLLRLSHPLYREGFAKKLHDAGLIEKHQAAEFIKGD